MKQLRICHSADWHIEVNGAHKYRETEYSTVLNDFAQHIINGKYDLIVIAGDVFDRAKTEEVEKLIFIKWCKLMISKGFEIVVTAGNHDLLQRHYSYDDGTGIEKTLVDSIKLCVEAIDSTKLHYIEQTGFYKITVRGIDVIFANWSHKAKYSVEQNEINPWNTDEDKIHKVKNAKAVVIDLFHDPIYNCQDWDGSVLKGNNDNRVHPNEFKGHLALLGDIHIPMSYVNVEGANVSYSSSLILRNYGEGNYYEDGKLVSSRMDKHGYRDVTIEVNDDNSFKQCTSKFVPLQQYRAFHTIDITTPEELDTIELKYQAKKQHVRLRLGWDTSENIEDITALRNRLRTTYPIQSIETLGTKARVNADLAKVDANSIERLFEETEIEALAMRMAKDYAGQKWDNEDLRNKALAGFNEKLKANLSSLNIDSVRTNITLDRLDIDNFLVFENATFDLNDLSQYLTKIEGTNGVGKTTLMTAIIWAATNQFADTQVANRKEWLVTLFNDKLTDSNTAEVRLTFSSGGDTYEVTRRLHKIWRKNATKGQHWKHEVTKVIQEVELIKNGVAVETGLIADILHSLFGDYYRFKDMHFLDGRTVSGIINMKPSDLSQFILAQMGASWIGELRETRHAVKAELLDSLAKPSKPLSELEHIKLNADTDIAAIEELKNLDTSAIKDLTDSKDAFHTSRNTLLAKPPVVLSADALAIRNELINGSTHDILTAKNAKLIAETTDRLTTQCDEKLNADTINKAKDEAILLLNEDITVQQHSIDSLIATTKALAVDLLDIDTKLSNTVTDTIDKLKQSVNSLKVDEFQPASDKLAKLYDDLTKRRSEILNDEESKLETLKLPFYERCKKLNDAMTQLVAQQIETSTLVKASTKTLATWDSLLESGTCPTCTSDLTSGSHAHSSKQTAVDADEVLKTKLTSIETNIAVLNTAYNDNQTALGKLVLTQEAIDEISASDKTVLDIGVKIDTVRLEKAACELKIKNINEVIEAIKLQTTKHPTIVKLNTDIQSDKARIESEIISITDVAMPPAKAALAKTKAESFKLLSEKISITAITASIENTKLAIDALKLSNSKLQDQFTEIKHYDAWLETKKLDDAKVEKLTTAMQDLDHKLAVRNQNISRHDAQLISLTSALTIAHQELENAIDWEIKTSIFDMYNKIVGTDTLAKALFTTITQVLNDDLKNLVDGLNFKLYFNEWGIFEFIDEIGYPSARQMHQISGMEESFTALALIGVIKARKLNQNVNFIMIDEITGKLNSSKDAKTADDNSDQINKNYQELFMLALKKFNALTNSKILIVDHLLDFDAATSAIYITKDARGISRIVK